MIIKALSVKQPWANWIWNMWKTIETRSWRTHHRGPLLIVSSLKPDEGVVKRYPEFDIQLLGHAIPITNLIDCRPMTNDDVIAAKCDTYPKAQSFVLDNIRRIKPFPVKGNQGLYNVELPEEYHAIFWENKRLYEEYRMEQLKNIPCQPTLRRSSTISPQG